MESVLSQDYQPIEYLVMDGGSTDGSLDIIRRHAARLSHWESGPDGGHAAAINSGWRRCRGEILAEIDASDVLTPGAVKAAVAALEAHPSWAMVYSDATWISDTGELQAAWKSRRFDIRDMLCGNYIAQPTVFMRRWALEQAGYYDPTFDMSMDFDLWMRVGRRHEVGYVPGHVFASMRTHADSKTAARSREWLDENIRVIRATAAYGPAEVPARVARAAIACAKIRHAGYCLRDGRRDEARAAMISAFAAASLEPWKRYGRELPAMIVSAFFGPSALAWAQRFKRAAGHAQ